MLAYGGYKVGTSPDDTRRAAAEQGGGLGDFFDCLCEAEILPDEQADALQDMTALRNQLLFDYDSVPIPSIHEMALSSSEVMVEYLACIAALPEGEEQAAESS